MIGSTTKKQVVGIGTQNKPDILADRRDGVHVIVRVHSCLQTTDFSVSPPSEDARSSQTDRGLLFLYVLVVSILLIDSPRAVFVIIDSQNI